MKGAFHGKTAGALSATWSKRVQGALRAAPPGRQARREREPRRAGARDRRQTSAAVIVEPIQGEGGIVLPPNGYLQGVREICDKKGVLLIADEMQTGLGRTGKLWAMENWGVVPDIMTSAKGLAGGVPIGATVDEGGDTQLAEEGRGDEHVRGEPARLRRGDGHAQSTSSRTTSRRRPRRRGSSSWTS